MPESIGEAATYKPSRKSIDIWTSIRDWRRTPSAIQKATEDAIKSSSYVKARTKNLEIEEKLFQAIFSSDVYLEPLDKSAYDEKSAQSKKLVARFLDTELPSAKIAGSLYIHELEIINSSDISMPRKDIVLIHGYMAALGYFLKNVEQLALSYPNCAVHVLDLPGFGNSARPRFPTSITKLPEDATKLEEMNHVIEAEDWFIDKLEEWRIIKGLEHFDLIGHSMGAYLSSCYLMKYNNQANGPTIVEKFALVSPMGTEPSEISLISSGKFQFDHQEVKSDPLKEVLASQDFKHDGVNQDFIDLWEKLGRPRFPDNFFLRSIWQRKISPFQVLQWFGPFYSKILSLWSFQRFKDLQSNKEGDATDNTDLILKLHDYSFSVFNQYQASGEIAITMFINHEILPRLPLSDRGFVEYLNEQKIDTIWIYGENDWMNSKGGQYCVEKITKLGNSSATFQKIENAGHHLYLDNPLAFNQLIKDFFGYSN